MTITITIFVVLLLCIGWVGYPLYQASRVEGEIVRSAIPYEQHPAHPSHRVLIAGDSTGVGVGTHDPRDSMAGRLGRDYPSWDLTNVSVSGLRLAGLTEVLGARLTDHYDLIFLHIGANDITHFTSLKKVKDELASILDDATAHAPRVIVTTSGDVGLASVFRFPLSALVSHRTREVRNIFITEIQARPSVSYVDLYKDAAHDIFLTDIPKYYAPDRFHPSGEGYGVWYAESKKEVDRGL